MVLGLEVEGVALADLQGVLQAVAFGGQVGSGVGLGAVAGQQAEPEQTGDEQQSQAGEYSGFHGVGGVWLGFSSWGISGGV